MILATNQNSWHVRLLAHQMGFLKDRHFLIGQVTMGETEDKLHQTFWPRNTYTVYLTGKSHVTSWLGGADDTYFPQFGSMSLPIVYIYIYSFDAFFWGIATPSPVFNLGTLSRSAQRHWIEVQEEWDKMAQPLPFALMWNDGCLEKVCVQLKVQSVSRWWFQICVIFIPTFGKLSNFTKIFQMGWNHQLVLVLKKRMISMMERFEAWDVFFWVTLLDSYQH